MSLKRVSRNPFIHFADPSDMEMVLQEIDIQFERADKGLGLSIAGGQGSTPYKDNDEGIFISRVTPNGPADLAGLRKDDKVISVNGHACLEIDHYEAVGILKAAGSFISMRVVREVFTRRRRLREEEAAAAGPVRREGSTSSLSRAGSSHSQQPYRQTNGGLSSVSLSSGHLYAFARRLPPHGDVNAVLTLSATRAITT